MILCVCVHPGSINRIICYHIIIRQTCVIYLFTYVLYITCYVHAADLVLLHIPF